MEMNNKSNRKLLAALAVMAVAFVALAAIPAVDAADGDSGAIIKWDVEVSFDGNEELNSLVDNQNTLLQLPQGDSHNFVMIGNFYS